MRVEMDEDKGGGGADAAATEETRGMLYDACCQLMATEAANEELMGQLEQTVASPGAASQLADILWLFEVGADTDEEKTRLVQLVRAVAEKRLVAEDLLRERLEPETLEAAGLLSSAALFSKKQIRINTAQLYRQQKYNLLREESEGFAKLVTSLLNATDADSLLEQVVKLIGYFDLDPNRVLDLVVDVYGQQLGMYEIYEELLMRMAFPASTVANVVGFKLGFLARERMDAEGVVTVVARLIKRGFCTLEGIYPHMLPSDGETVEELQAIRDKIKTINPAAGEKSGSDSKDLAAEFQPTVHDIGAAIGRGLGNTKNQKILLVAGLLQVGEFDRARWLLEKFPAAAVVPTVARQVCHTLHAVIEPLVVRRGATKGHLDGFMGAVALTEIQAAGFDAVLPRLMTWLKYIKGGELYLDAVLVSKLCRVGCAHLLHDGSDATREGWMGIVMYHLLPALVLTPSNPAVAYEIWELLKLFPYANRYAIYGYWRDELDTATPAMLLARTTILGDVRKVMRRLTKENVRQYGRLLAKLAHSNPAIVFPVILEQLQAYDNLIQPVVDSLKYVTPLGYDVLSFVLIDCLADPRKDRLKEDGTNIAGWLQGLAFFTGSLFRRYHAAVDVEGVLQYIVNRLYDEQSIDLIVLSEIVNRMGGIESVENISETHLEALAGGPLLLSEVLSGQTTAAVARPNKRATQRLVQVLVQRGLAVQLWILLAQQRSLAVFRTDYPHLKLIAILVDAVDAVFAQYSLLMAQAVRDGLIIDEDALPDAATLISKYHIDTDLAFTMRRTWLAAFGSSSGKEDLAGISTLEAALLQSFWFRDLGNVHVPVERYQAELLRLKAALAASNTNKEQRERIPKLIEGLEAELEAQHEAVQLQLQSLSREKDLWFAAKSDDEVNRFYLQCLLPRSLLTPADAVYCAKFISLLHSTGARNFSIVALFDVIIRELASVLAMATEQEAHNFGRLFASVMGDMIVPWHQDGLVFRQAAVGSEGDQLPGLLLPPARRESEMQTHYSYEEYRHLVFAWHRQLHDIFTRALKGGDYLPMKNAIIVLTRLGSCFPAVRPLGRQLKKTIARLKDERREDLKIMAVRYAAMLGAAEGRWVAEEAFHQVDGRTIESGEIQEIRDDEAAEPMEEDTAMSVEEGKSSTGRTPEIKSPREIEETRVNRKRTRREPAEEQPAKRTPSSRDSPKESSVEVKETRDNRRRNAERGSRGEERNTERNAERGNSRGDERNAERSNNRGDERNAERGGSDQTHGGRTPLRKDDRPHERSRPAERERDRPVLRPHERSERDRRDRRRW